MSIKRRGTKRKYFSCERCRSMFILYRHHQHDKPKGHIKHIWCYRCKKVMPHRQLN